MAARQVLATGKDKEEEVDIKVVKGKYGKYLRTDPDKTTRNNLDDLPDC